MKTRILLCSILGLGLLALACTGCSSETPDEIKTVIFPGVDNYAKVVAYHYEGNDGKYIIDKGKLHSNIINEAELNAGQTDKLLATLNSPKTYGGGYTRCFRPHLGVVFYDSAEKPKAHISICFECNHHYSTPIITAYNEAPNGSFGYSPEGRQQLVEFCTSLGFGQCGSDEEADVDAGAID